MAGIVVVAAIVAGILLLMVGWVARVVAASYPTADDFDCDEFDISIREGLKRPGRME